MSQEGQLLDKKSLRAVSGKTAAAWAELVKDCVAFANATGGHLLIGIEDRRDQPPADQRIPAQLPDTLRKQITNQSLRERFGLPEGSTRTVSQIISATISQGLVKNHPGAPDSRRYARYIPAWA